ncbi:MAG: hypothetical protein QOH06_1329 [Acidobacteriota bacterium]|jgi:uncharacterized protein YegL|nr:hypothetical protein [Acidobacteriota bacterium]
MPYEALATSKTPALIIYLLDCSSSMNQPLDGAPKIEHVNQAVEKVLVRMVQRSTKGEIVAPRYRLAMIAYSDKPTDVLQGILPINEVVDKGTPQFSAQGMTDTEGAFRIARDLLKKELTKLSGHPAPMVCHLTDGEYNTGDPEPIAREIMQMANDDGNVLVENIFIGSDLTRQPINSIESWSGISDPSELAHNYAKKLLQMSSPLPPSYASVIQEMGYGLLAGSRMLIPGTSKDLIELAFTMSGATPTA